MTRIEPLNDEEMGDSVDFLKPTIERLGFLPNSQRIMARKPQLLLGINELYKAIMHRTDSSLSPGLLYLVGNAASLAAGCMYCVAHSGGAANHSGEDAEKIAAIWEFETSELFTESERVALRFAQAASSIPNMVTDQDFEALKEYYTDYQIVELLSIISLYGFFNRWNDTLATPLEEGPKAFAEKAISDKGWAAGKHS